MIKLVGVLAGMDDASYFLEGPFSHPFGLFVDRLYVREIYVFSLFFNYIDRSFHY